jgi:flagellar biosynthesis protein FlhA
VLDIGLTVSFAFAILIFVTAIFIERPLDFSSFPSVLLASLMLRLALNVSSTKLIISEGHTGTAAAGGVIEGFAMFIMGGNLFVGLVVFGVLIIVNFMVITKGAGRMAEVGARFALDAMPGKQLAIDSDLAVGAITHEEAKHRREKEQEEASFLGSLDGASKFVKGDAIAGLLITALNLLAGIGFGLSMHQLTLTEALSNYSVLTVGDGLVSQIPALIVSVSAALLLSKGRDDGAIDGALGIQLGTNATPLGLVAGILMTFAIFPGLPFLPFMIASVIFGALAYFAHSESSLKILLKLIPNKSSL